MITAQGAQWWTTTYSTNQRFAFNDVHEFAIWFVLNEECEGSLL